MSLQDRLTDFVRTVLFVAVLIPMAIGLLIGAAYGKIRYGSIKKAAEAWGFDGQ